MKDYLAINKEAWNAKTEVHLASDFYNMEAFLKGKSTLKEIELGLLGDVNGKSILHLQCHFGQDTLSLQRMGAQAVGIDLSDKAIEAARQLAVQTGTNAQFVLSDVYNLPSHLQQQFDIVFTSYGTIGWLPDMDKWASVVAHFLKPGGKFVFVEFHPVVWMFDDDFSKVGYDYFNTGPIVENETGTYADREADISKQYVGWNHGLGEVLGSLISNGLTIESFDEIDYSPYACFKHTHEFEPGKFRIAHIDKKIPMVYALTAVKK